MVLLDGKTLTYGYDAKGRLTSLTDWASQQTTYGYDSLGRPNTVQRSNGVDSTYQYDAESRLTSFRHTNGSNVLTYLTYQSDARGNRTQAYEAASRTNCGNRQNHWTDDHIDAQHMVRCLHDGNLRIFATYRSNPQLLGIYVSR
jgi:YD repeat-containing protein